MYSMCCKCAQCTSAQFSYKLFSRAGMVSSKCCALNYCILHDIFFATDGWIYYS